MSSYYTLTITNNSDWDIREIHLSSANSPEWGKDHLGRHVMRKGQTLTIRDIAFGQWDMKVVDEDGDECIMQNIKVTEDLSWTITDDRLLGCERLGDLRVRLDAEVRA